MATEIYPLWDQLTNKIDTGKQIAIQTKRLTRDKISKEEAIKKINECRVDSVRFYPTTIDRSLNVSEIELKHTEDSTYQYINISDFDPVRDAAQSSRNNCGRIEIDDERNHHMFITSSQAEQMLKNCEIYLFQYDTDFDSQYFSSTSFQEFNPQEQDTGTILDTKEIPDAIYVDSKSTPSLLPIAQEAQRKCPLLEIIEYNEYN